MKRIVHFLAYGATALTILFALILPIKVFPALISLVGALDLRIAPWFSGGDPSFVIDRGTYQIQVYHPVYPALVGEGSKGFVQLVWQPRKTLPSRIQDSLDLNGDGNVDCEVSVSNPQGEGAVLLLTVIPKSSWVLPVQSSRTTSLTEILIERGKDSLFVRIPVQKRSSS